MFFLCIICISYLSSSPSCFLSFAVCEHLSLGWRCGGHACWGRGSGWKEAKPARSLPALPRPCILLAPSSFWLATFGPLSVSGHLHLNGKIKGFFCLLLIKKKYRNKFKWLTARKGFLGRETVAERPWMGRPGLCNNHHLFPHPDLCFS